MKQIMVVLISFLFSGCYFVDAYMMTKFDNNNYMLITEMRTDAQVLKSKCEYPIHVQLGLIDLKHKSLVLKNYHEKISFNDNSKTITSSVYDIIKSTKIDETTSKIYCTKKMEIVELSLEKYQDAIANKIR